MKKIILNLILISITSSKSFIVNSKLKNVNYNKATMDNKIKEYKKKQEKTISKTQEASEQKPISYKNNDSRNIKKNRINRKILYSIIGAIGVGAIYALKKIYMNKKEEELDSFDKFNYGLLDGDFSEIVRTKAQAKVLGDFIREHPGEIALTAATTFLPGAAAGLIPAKSIYITNLAKTLLGGRLYRFIPKGFSTLKMTLSSLVPLTITGKATSPYIENAMHPSLEKILPKEYVSPKKSLEEGFRKEFSFNKKDFTKKNILSFAAEEFVSTFVSFKIFGIIGKAFKNTLQKAPTAIASTAITAASTGLVTLTNKNGINKEFKKDDLVDNFYKSGQNTF
jgi:hypothetical protein